jgi:hypothetical protein
MLHTRTRRTTPEDEAMNRPRPASSAARGYGYHHRKTRAALAPTVEAGNAHCAQGLNGSSGTCHYPTRRILPGQKWALGHNDTRTAYIGPVHARCNQLDGASRGGKTIAARRAHTSGRIWRSRTW